MKSFFIHHMRKIYNAISRWRYFFRSSGGVVSSLAAWRSPTDEYLEFWFVLFDRLSSFNQLIEMSEILCIRNIGLVILARSSSFLISENKVCFGFSITAIFCFPNGRLYKSRTHLNKELIDLPDGFNRTQAIQHRIETAGIKRKITKDQVRVIRINLSGTHEDMKHIEAEGRLDEWSKDTVDYLKKEFGEKNVVSAVLHMDEKTPHIHASVVPIVTGQRRKAKEGSKNKSTVRLCADDIMTKTKMVEYQDNYAEVVAKYGLERGIRGSEARHITTGEYYRDIFEKAETVKEEVGLLQQQKAEEQLRLAVIQKETDRKDSELEEKEAQLRQIKSEVVKVGFEKSAKSAGKEVLEGIGTLMGNPKAKKLQSEVDSLKQDIEILQEEKQSIEKLAQKAITEKDRLILEKDSLIATRKGKLDKLFDSIPILKDYDFIIRLC